MALNENNDIVTQMLERVDKIYELAEMKTQCSICHNTQSFSFNTYSDVDVVCNLLHDGWTIINDLLYCPECRKQYETLRNIVQLNIRPSKISYYLNIAKEVSTRATCLRKKYGAVLIKNDTIISTGYNGSPRGTKNCIDIHECRREKLNIPRGQCYEMCRSIHAEQNCIINASKNDMMDSDLYLYGVDASTNKIIDNLDSCQLCKKMIINAGIKSVIFARPNNEYEIKNVSEWVINDETLTDKFGY